MVSDAIIVNGRLTNPEPQIQSQNIKPRGGTICSLRVGRRGVEGRKLSQFQVSFIELALPFV